MPILDIQRSGLEIGRIRTGIKVTTANGREAPSRLDTFRLTTSNRAMADAVASLLGGAARPWDRNKWEVVTEASEIFVTIPPANQIITQHYEMWTAAGCVRRCDSQFEQKSGGPCLCPHADDPTDESLVKATAIERARLSRMNPPRACKPVTRLNVMIPDLPGLGVWRLETHSFYAAREMGNAADLMEFARGRGIFLPGRVFITHRETVKDGRKTRYPVPALDITEPFRRLTSGQLADGGITAQLPPAPAAYRKALESGQTAEPSQPAQAPGRRLTPQEIADMAVRATDAQEIHRLGILTHNEDYDTEMVVTDGAWEELRTVLNFRWRELNSDAAAGDAE